MQVFSPLPFSFVAAPAGRVKSSWLKAFRLTVAVKRNKQVSAERQAAIEHALAQASKEHHRSDGHEVDRLHIVSNIIRVHEEITEHKKVRGMPSALSCRRRRRCSHVPPLPPRRVSASGARVGLLPNQKRWPSLQPPFVLTCPVLLATARGG